MGEKILEILSEICDEELKECDLDLDLFEEELLDSMGVAELLVEIEATFGVYLPPTEYEKEQLSTIRKIEKVLEEKGVK